MLDLEAIKTDMQAIKILSPTAIRHMTSMITEIERLQAEKQALLDGIDKLMTATNELCDNAERTVARFGTVSSAIRNHTADSVSAGND